MPSCGSRNRRQWAARWTAAATLLVALLASAPFAQSSNPADLYKEALAREALLRKELDAHRPPAPTTPLLRRLRVMVGAYEDLALLFPTSGHSDDALWQGARLSADAFWRFRDAADQDAALRLLRALTARYPTSSLVKQAPPLVRRLQEAPPAAVTVPPAIVTAAPLPPPLQPGSASPPQAGRQPAVTRSPGESGAPSSTAATPSAGGVAARDGATTPGVTPPVMLRAIRRHVLPDALRITLEIDREVPFHHERLDGPPRVFVDLVGVRAVEALRDVALPFSDGAVRQIRVGRHLDGRTRVVLDLQASSAYSVYAMYDPYRVVIDFEQRPPAAPSRALPSAPPRLNGAASGVAPAAAAAGGVQPATPSANSTGGFSLSRQLGLAVTRIAIDPGHGGHDPGAQAQGLTEAEIVLDIALRLEKLLSKEQNIEAVLTRRTNAYVPLEERTAIANRSGADLFLSIHVNASAVVAARGVETYYLNFAPNSEAEAIAARENAASGRSMRDLPNIVEAIARNDKLNESRDFATIVQAALYGELRKSNRNMRDLGVKQAPFMVLIGAGMPGVLAEISFMTNRQEGALLKTEKYRQQIADALLAGVLRYQRSLKKTPAVAATR